jgi:carnitine 3-dehydrogenase
MRHMLRQFGPCLKWPWTHLEAPELTEALIDRMVEGTQRQAGGRSIRELERLRDDCLVAIQQVLRQYDIGAGSTLRALETRLYADSAAAARGGLSSDRNQPARLLEFEVRPDWVDYHGHMTDSRFLQVFGDATDALWRSVGIDESYRQTGHSFYTVESHVTHRAEASAMEPLYVTVQVLDVDDKRVHLFHSLHRRADGAQLATGEQLYLHVSTRLKRAAAMPQDLRARLDAWHASHQALPVPSQARRHVGMAR